MGALGRWKFSPRSWELSGRFQNLPGQFLGEAEVLSFAALLDLFQVCLLALPELTVSLPCPSTNCTEGFLASRHQRSKEIEGKPS